MRIRSSEKARGRVSPAKPAESVSGGNPRSIVEQLPQAIWVADAQGAIIHCNQYWHKFSGLDLVQTAESGWFSIVHPEDRPKARAGWRKLITTGTPMLGEYRFLRARDGEYRWHLVQGVSIKEGNGIQKIGTAVDIHAQKATELDLRQSEDQLSLAIEAGRFGTWDFSVTERSFKTSYRARAMFGHPLDVELTYEEFFGMVHAEDRATLRRVYNRAMETGGLSEFEISYRITRPDGAERWITARGKGVFSGAGSERKPERLIGTVQDITERKTAEKALHDSEEKFRTAFHSNPEAMSITTLADGVYLDVNNAFLRVTGFTREDVVGRRSIEVNSWVDTDHRARMVKALKTHGRLESMETSFHKKNGEVFQVHLSAEMIEIGNIQCVLATSQDVSERTRVTEELRRSEEPYRSLIERSPFGICRISAQGRFLLVNPALAQMLGYDSASELLALDVATQVCEEPEARDALISSLAQDPSKQPPIEARWKRRDGQVIIVRLVGTAIRDDQGRLLHSEVFVEPISAQ